MVDKSLILLLNTKQTKKEDIMDLLKNIQGMKMIVFWSLAIMVTVLAMLNTKNIGGGNTAIEISVFCLFFIFSVTAFAFAFKTLGFVSITLYFTFVSAIMQSTYSAVLALGLVFLSAFWVSIKHKVKWWKCFPVFFAEAVLLYTQIGLAELHVAGLSMAVIVFLLAESKLRLWLACNRPPFVLLERREEQAGYGSYRRGEATVSGRPISGSLCSRIHRRLYKIYIRP